MAAQMLVKSSITPSQITKKEYVDLVSLYKQGLKNKAVMERFEKLYREAYAILKSRNRPEDMEAWNTLRSYITGCDRRETSTVTFVVGVGHGKDAQGREFEKVVGVASTDFIAGDKFNTHFYDYLAAAEGFDGQGYTKGAVGKANEVVERHAENKHLSVDCNVLEVNYWYDNRQLIPEEVSRVAALAHVVPNAVVLCVQHEDNAYSSIKFLQPGLRSTWTETHELVPIFSILNSELYAPGKTAEGYKLVETSTAFEILITDMRHACYGETSYMEPAYKQEQMLSDDKIMIASAYGKDKLVAVPLGDILENKAIMRLAA
ncbi:MAG: hypothetical protein Q7T16_02125 [Candidatus Burarchaeum sp.]|nr:hypothetical protein [Candidatus Burarchaeum sp.]MDO8339431.1 hypothetical protein [Candidatus Burarchaeum sp.]